MVNPGGGSRRNPKRKNAGGFSTSVTLAEPSAGDVEAAFQNHLKTMAKGGAYGDNYEIAAFAMAHEVDVKIYSEEKGYFYIVPGGKSPGGASSTLYIVHHVNVLYLVQAELS